MSPESSSGVTDLHEITSNMVIERTGRTLITFYGHVKKGMIEPGLKRPGVAGHFWTKAQVNRYLRKLGMRDRCFE